MVPNFAPFRQKSLGDCTRQHSGPPFQPKGWNTGLSKSGHVPRGTRGHPTPYRAKCPPGSVCSKSVVHLSVRMPEPVYVGVVECAPASPYTYSSCTHRFPDERTPIEATPLSATSAEFVSGLGLCLGLGSHSSSHAPPHAPLLLATLLSHNIPFPRVL
jgi:hypothetical protein